MSNIVLYSLIFLGIILVCCIIVLIRRRKLRQLHYQTKIFLKQSEPIFWTDLPENRCQ